MSRNLNLVRRDELFREFEYHPMILALAKEIRIIDDQIAELNVGKKRAKVESSKYLATARAQSCEVRGGWGGSTAQTGDRTAPTGASG